MARRKGPARDQRREEFWRRIVTGQLASGQTIRDWCARHDVTEASFYAWRRTLAQRGVTGTKHRSRLVAVEVTPDVSVGNRPVLGLVVNGLNRIWRQ
jgi:transposase-like protein